MKILNSDLDSAVQKGIISSDQASQLWNHFESLRSDQARFQGIYVLYYFGGLLVLASMSWFLTTAWGNGLALMGISALFATIYILAAKSLWNKENLKIPGGLLITAAVGLTPVFIYGFQKAVGLWPETTSNFSNYQSVTKGNYLFMELGTIIAALTALRFFRFAFVTFPLSISLWYMSMDITSIVLNKNNLSFDEKEMISILFGFAVLWTSYYVDKKHEDIDFAFWTYLAGALSFWGGLSSLLMFRESILAQFSYCLINVFLIVIAIYLRRRIFLILGSIGILYYLDRLLFLIFKDSYGFPIVLALLGIFILFLGIKYQKNKHGFESYVESYFPRFLKKWRPKERT